MTLKVNFINNYKKKGTFYEIVFVKDFKIKNADLSRIFQFAKNHPLFCEDLFYQKENKNITYIFVNCNNIELSNDYEKIGSMLFDYLNKNKIENSNIQLKNNNLNYMQVERIVHGAKLKSYDFEIYKSSKKKNNTINIDVLGANKNSSIQLRKKLSSITEGVFFTRDLVLEPPNVLSTDEYVKKLLSLKKIGIKINVLDEKKNDEVRYEFIIGCW